MTFAEWLETQVNHDDLIGDVARDARGDSRPNPANTLTAWKNHLTTGGACREAKEVLTEAWEAYKASK